MTDIPDYLPDNLGTKPLKGRDAHTKDELHSFAIIMLALGILKELTQHYPGVACKLMTGQTLGAKSLSFILALVDELGKSGALIEELSECNPSDLNPVGGIDFEYDNDEKEEQA